MNQEKQREAYEKMLKKCPDILTPMKANRWSPVGKNTIYAALKNGEIEFLAVINIGMILTLFLVC